VRLLSAGKPVAEFRIGKSPKGGDQEIYVRREDDSTVYRTRTLLTRDQDRPVEVEDDPYGGGAVRGFQWHNHVNTLAQKWIDTALWDLKGAEATELWLTRTGDDAIEVKLTKKADDKWELVDMTADDAGRAPVPADADAADGILSPLRSLNVQDVVGAYGDVAAEYGLDAPSRTLVLTMRRKVEKAPPPPQEGEEPQPPKEEYVTLSRTLEVGKKITRKSYNAYADKFDEEDYYAIRIGPEKGIEDKTEAMRAGYVFLVRTYSVDPLGKKLADLKQKSSKPGDGDGEDESCGEGDGEEDDGMPAPPDEGEGDTPPDDAPTTEVPRDDAAPKERDGGAAPEGCGESADGCGEGCGCGCGEAEPGDGCSEPEDGCGG
jgi:hypothetical protein